MIVDFYPSHAFDKTTQQATSQEYLYLQQIQSVVFLSELSDKRTLAIKCIKDPIKDMIPLEAQGSTTRQQYRILNYVLTDGAGGKKYLCALTYNEVYLKQLTDGSTLKAVSPKAIVLVSVQPMFQFQEQVLRFIYSKLI